MQNEQNFIEVYQFRICLRHISPAIWRRLLVRNDSTITDLHYIIQIAMGWTKRGAHLLLQVRIKTLNGELKETFKRWYPKMISPEKEMKLAS